MLERFVELKAGDVVIQNGAASAVGQVCVVVCMCVCVCACYTGIPGKGQLLV